MGGCRCSYRNCAVKSDGKTHMFHYPVFDKVRCHQWIMNARRLDFLDLKVSQVKNRVICQHHFKDEYFMNFTKGKLTFDAVPSEDGPYCDTSKLIENPHDFSKLYPIVVEDIENDLCPLDNKKANFSLKYSDFLTNSETPESSSFLKTEDDKLKITQCTDLADINFILENNLDEKLNNINFSQVLDNVDLFNDKLTAIKSNTRNLQAYPVLIVPPFTQITNSETIKTNNNSEIIMCSANNNVKNVSSLSKTRPKVQIISEKKITEPVSLKGHFKCISPSIVVNPVLNQNIQQTNDVTMMQMVPQNVSLDQTIKPVNLIEIDVNMHEPIMLQNQMPLPEQQTQNITPQNKTLNENTAKSVETSKSLLKKKIPSKRIAAIQEKRNISKLKKDLQSCGAKMEKPKSMQVKQIENEKCQEKVPTPKINTTQNGDYLSRLEARMSRMENLLLNKIDQNSQKIIDLKQTFRTTQNNKNISTQTNENVSVYKKYLFREISEYLSSETKNLLYEELFINDQFAQKTNLRSRIKRRKYR